MSTCAFIASERSRSISASVRPRSPGGCASTGSGTVSVRWVRRVTARTRATSSRTLNGFAR